MKLTSLLLITGATALVVAFFGSLPAFAAAATALLLAGFCHEYTERRPLTYHVGASAPSRRSPLRLAA